METSTSQASSLREKFFSLSPPDIAQERYPYTGRYQFVPFLKTTEWTVQKIYNLAKLHVKLVQDLRSIFLITLQDIHNQISNDGTTLMQGFYGMHHHPPGEGQSTLTVPLLHSIHNTGKSNTKVSLVTTNHYDAAVTQLSAIQSILSANIAPEFHDRVFVAPLHAGITGQQIDSFSSCNSAAYATQLLKLYNPQDGEDIQEIKPTKRFQQVPLTYAAAVTDPLVEEATAASKATVSSLTSSALDQLYEKMKKYVADSKDAPGL